MINCHEEGPLDQLKEVVRELRKEGHEVEARITFEGTDAADFAAEATNRGADLIIAAGGDGTINKVVNGIFRARPTGTAESRPRLGVVPLGTGNDFAGSLELPMDVTEAVRRATQSGDWIADVATINGRYFVNVSSGGLGAEATEEASDKAKKLLGALAYFVTGVRKFVSLTPSQGRFVADGEVVFEGGFLFFAVGNGRRTGGGNWVTPKAELDDGVLDLCIVEEVNHAELLRILPELRNGDHVGNEHVTYLRFKELTIEPRGELSVNADGEPIEGHDFVYTLVPRAIRLARGPAPAT